MIRYIWQEKDWPRFTWRSDEVIEALGSCNFKRGRLLGRVASLGMEMGREAQAEVLTAEVLQTSAIEGQILSPDSVRSSVARRLGLPEAGVPGHDRYTEGLVDVLLDATVHYDRPLTVERLHGWQAALFPTGFSGLHRIRVGAQDEKCGIRYYSLSAQIMEERSHYYEVLESCQKGGLDITGWLVWFFGCFERAVDGSDRLIGKVLRKARFWEVNGRVQMTERQRRVVNRLLDAGPGGFSGGLTTRKYAGMTKASRATSYREITDLLNKKILVQNPGKGRSVSYDLAWPA